MSFCARAVKTHGKPRSPRAQSAPILKQERGESVHTDSVGSRYQLRLRVSFHQILHVCRSRILLFTEGRCGSPPQPATPIHSMLCPQTYN